MPNLNVRGDFKYVDGKYVKLTSGKRGVLLIAVWVISEKRTRGATETSSYASRGSTTWS
ncbi:hypothetical protein HS7_14820 [Sulfolobales archaeon HS-7]|nr:hypothetical protein HS7_14820 [Sulfolobales archaeon HS-7]